MNLRDPYSNPNLEPPEPVIIGTCPLCQGEVYEGDDFAEGLENGIYHVECLNDHMNFMAIALEEWPTTPDSEKAIALMLE